MRGARDSIAVNVELASDPPVEPSVRQQLLDRVDLLHLELIRNARLRREADIVGRLSRPRSEWSVLNRSLAAGFECSVTHTCCTYLIGDNHLRAQDHLIAHAQVLGN